MEVRTHCGHTISIYTKSAFITRYTEVDEREAASANPPNTLGS
jgi:hypothetical protein